ncbi:MAG: hypothetical protein JOZ73_11000 [Solirubrobacterales bacterium]|nr:hypothetical protein [Solirubrobacterales bacterium]
MKLHAFLRRVRPSPAMVVACAALFVSLGGGAYAAIKLKNNSVTTKKIKNGAVTTKKLKNGAVTTPKIANGAVTTPKIANGAVNSGQLGAGAVGTGNLADGAVTTNKLDPSERSQAFQDVEGSGTVGPLPNLGSTPSTVATLNLPAGGHYVVTAESEFVNTDIGGPTSHYANCSLNSGGADIGDQAATYNAGGLAASGGVTVTGVSNGGAVTLTCKADDASHSFAFDRRIVAVRVASVG